MTLAFHRNRPEAPKIRKTGWQRPEPLHTTFIQYKTGVTEYTPRVKQQKPKVWPSTPKQQPRVSTTEYI